MILKISRIKIENLHNKSAVGDMKNYLLEAIAIVLAFVVSQFIPVMIGLLSATSKVKHDPHTKIIKTRYSLS